MAISYIISLTDAQTGESKTFISALKASEYLKRSKSYVRLRLERSNKTAYDINGNEYKVAVVGINKVVSTPKPKNPENQKYAGYKNPQLCYRCARAVGFCSWSKRFEPIEGWTAKPTKISHLGNKRCEKVCLKDIDSYYITECPLFIEEAKTARERKKQRKLLFEEERTRNTTET